jgi:hypothetical protein
LGAGKIDMHGVKTDAVAMAEVAPVGGISRWGCSLYFAWPSIAFEKLIYSYQSNPGRDLGGARVVK